MTNIKNYRNIIEEASKEKEHYLVVETQTLPSPEIFNYDDGMAYVCMYLESDGLDEGLASTLGGIFKGAKDSLSDLKDGTNDAFKRKMSRFKSTFSNNMNKDMKKQVKAITKNLKDKYYFDLNLTIQSFEKKKSLYSEPFFEEMVKSFSLDPDVERQVWKEYKPQIRKFGTSLRNLYKEHRRENPNSDKAPKNNMMFHYLPKKLKKKVIDDANYLVGSIIGFTAAVSIADYFQKNPATFKECSDTINENIDVNGYMMEKTINNIFEHIQKSNEISILQHLSDLDVDESKDREFNWDDDIEDEHETIYKQYVEGK